jgi:hypothetical protein
VNNLIPLERVREGARHVLLSTDRTKNRGAIFSGKD